MNSALRLTTFSLALALCACGDRSRAPAHSSPSPVVVASGLDPGITDKQRGNTAWYDSTADRVMWLRDGAAAITQDVSVKDAIDNALDGAVSSVRVFDDGSFIVGTEDSKIHIFPMGGVVQHLDPKAIELTGIDGLSIDDYWYLFWPQEGTGIKACHHLTAPEGDTCDSISIDSSAGYDLLLAVAGDGTVYVSKKDNRLYVLNSGQTTAVEGFQAAELPTGFRRSSSTLWVMAGDSAYSLAGTQVTRVETAADIAGTADDYAFAQYDMESVQVDPACSNWLYGCDTKTLWSQTVYFHTVNGKTTELGYETCSADDDTRCNGPEYGLTTQNGKLFIIGTSLRTLAE